MASNLQANDNQQNFDILLQDILEMTLEVLGVETGAIRLYEEKTHELIIRAHKGLSEESLINLKRRRYGEGLSWKSVLSNAPIIDRGLNLETYTHHPSGYALIFPLLSYGRLIGTITIFYREPPAKLKERDAGLFSLIGNQIGIALENARLADEFRKRNVALEALEKLSRAVNQLKLDQVFNDATDEIMQLFGCRFVFIRTIDRKTGEFVYVGHKGLSAAELARMPRRHVMEDSYLMAAIKAKKVYVIQDLRSALLPREGRQKFLRSIGCRGLVITPLAAKEKILGVIIIGYSAPYSAADEEMNLYTSIGELVGAAIENAALYEEMLQENAERRRAEAELTKYQEHLETLVKERTAELENKNRDLLQLNTTLEVLSKKREADKKYLEENLVFNINNLVTPCLEKMKSFPVNAKQRLLLEAVETHLQESISPLMINLKQFNLTAKEIQVAAMVKDGKTTKKIAAILGVEPCSIDAHRNSIRKKLGLPRKANLQARLLTL